MWDFSNLTAKKCKNSNQSCPADFELPDLYEFKNSEGPVKLSFHEQGC